MRRDGRGLKERLARSGPLGWLIFVVFLSQFFALYVATRASGDDSCHGCFLAIFWVVWLALVVLLAGLLILWAVLIWRERRR